MTDPLELISDYLDNDLSDEELAELEAWILADSEHAAIFARHATLDRQIRYIMTSPQNGTNDHAARRRLLW